MLEKIGRRERVVASNWTNVSKCIASRCATTGRQNLAGQKKKEYRTSPVFRVLLVANIFVFDEELFHEKHHKRSVTPPVSQIKKSRGRNGGLDLPTFCNKKGYRDADK